MKKQFLFSCMLLILLANTTYAKAGDSDPWYAIFFYLIILIGFLLPYLVVLITVMIIGWIVFPNLITLLKSKTILCNNCLRYTHPLKSQYKIGRRYCEHCQKQVEQTNILGRVLFTFGTFPLKLDRKIYLLKNPGFQFIKLPCRTFVLANPGFHSAERIVEVSEVYIDTKTCDPRRIEEFITYIVGYSPKLGVRSVQIFYQGELSELGDNLKNALRNNFNRIKRIEV